VNERTRDADSRAARPERLNPARETGRPSSPLGEDAPDDYRGLPRITDGAARDSSRFVAIRRDSSRLSTVDDSSFEVSGDTTRRLSGAIAAIGDRSMGDRAKVEWSRATMISAGRRTEEKFVM